MKKGKVLIVDDNVDMLLIGERIFTKAGFEYLSARGGREGLEMMRSEGVDLVILDYMLPDLNGLQFLKCMNTEEEYAGLRSIPVIILTARTDYLEELDTFYAAGLRAILTKPFGHRELVQVVENVLRLEKALMASAEEGSGLTPPPAESANAAAVVAAAAAPGVAAHAEPAAAPTAGWADDLRIAATTIARLTAELRRDLPASLNEQQRLDLDAVLTSSRRLVRLIDAHFPESEIFQEERLLA
jgi:CheY-like chemotaxis protein